MYCLQCLCPIEQQGLFHCKNCANFLPNAESYGQLATVRNKLQRMSVDESADTAAMRQELVKLQSQVEQSIMFFQQELLRLRMEKQNQPIGFEQELNRTTQRIEPPKTDDRFRIDYKPPGMP